MRQWDNSVTMPGIQFWLASRVCKLSLQAESANVKRSTAPGLDLHVCSTFAVQVLLELLP